jgi:hypothetical protein
MLQYSTMRFKIGCIHRILRPSLIWAYALSSRYILDYNSWISRILNLSTPTSHTVKHRSGNRLRGFRRRHRFLNWILGGAVV